MRGWRDSESSFFAGMITGVFLILAIIVLINFLISQSLIF